MSSQFRNVLKFLTMFTRERTAVFLLPIRSAERSTELTPKSHDKILSLKRLCRHRVEVGKHGRVSKGRGGRRKQCEGRDERSGG